MKVNTMYSALENVFSKRLKIASLHISNDDMDVVTKQIHTVSTMLTA